MVAVSLDFIPPQEEGIVALKIFEGPRPDGPLDLIEIVSDVGAYPSYITRYTTENAISRSDWFAISWEDAKGGEYERSEPVQGGTISLVAILKDRIQVRDPLIPERVAVQECQTVIEQILRDPDPNPANVTSKQLTGMTYLAMALCYIGLSRSTGNVQKFTAGLVSLQTGAAASTDKQIDYLIKQAQKLLGISGGRVGQIIDLPIAQGFATIVDSDHSRLLIEVA